jgi:NitT/TauT family transport system substrate-binding protein
LLSSRPNRRISVAATLGLAAILLLSACGSDTKKTAAAAAAGASGAPTTTSPPTEVRLGYFPNITHAPAIIGVEKGLFQTALAQNTLKAQTFNAGPDAVTALLSGAIDAAFVGPGPSINAYAKSDGEAIRIVAGSTSGGAALVVKPEIKTVADLKGKKVSSPQLGNTQDVALRKYLKDNGLATDTAGGGDVAITPLANADTLTAFANGDVQGAWVPEPFVTRLVQESGGKVLVDEATLWPDGKFVTTQLIVATEFLKKHPDIVKELITGENEAIKLLGSDPAGAQKIVNDGINKLTGKPLKDAVLAASFKNLTFTLDPVASSLKAGADNAVAVKLLDAVDLKGIYDLTIVNEVLAADGKPAVTGLS